MRISDWSSDVCSSDLLGTGSGAIAISIALACPQVAMIATDCSPGALDLARRNARTLRAQVDFYQGDWYDALPVTSTPAATEALSPCAEQKSSTPPAHRKSEERREGQEYVRTCR